MKKNAKLRFSFRFDGVSLAVVVFALWLAFSAWLPETDPFGYGIVMQAAALLVPTAAYLAVRGDGFAERMRFAAFSPSRVVFLLLFAVAIFALNLLAGILPHADGAVVLSTVPAGGGWLAVLSVAVLPALSEELFFRGVLLADLEKNGPAAAVIVSSLLFALFHFRLEKLLPAFLSGVLLALCVYVTRSLLASAAVHLFYNLAVLLGAERINSFFSATDERALVAVFLLVLLLICLIFIFGECQRTYAAYAAQNRSSAYVTRGGFGGVMLALFAPATVLCIILFIGSLLV